MKTAEQLLLEMDAEIAAKVAESVDMNKEEIETYVEAKKAEAYEECVKKIREAVEVQYATAKVYLQQLVVPVEKEDPSALDANESSDSTQSINEDATDLPELDATVETTETL